MQKNQTVNISKGSRVKQNIPEYSLLAHLVQETAPSLEKVFSSHFRHLERISVINRLFSRHKSENELRYELEDNENDNKESSKRL